MKSAYLSCVDTVSFPDVVVSVSLGYSVRVSLDLQLVGCSSVKPCSPVSVLLLRLQMVGCDLDFGT